MTDQLDGYLIGLDIGTSSVKGVAVALDGTLLARASLDHTMHRPHPGWAENDPDDWVAGVAGVTHALLRGGGLPSTALRGLAIDSQRDPLVMVGTDGRPLAPAIHWVDRRTETVLADLTAQLGYQHLLERTGIVPLPALALPVLAWTRQHRPEIWQQIHRVLSPKDYVLFRLTGEVGTDPTMLARTMLNDVQTDSWSDELREAVSLPAECLPAVAGQPWERVSPLRGGGAELLGVPLSTPIARGAGDDCTACLGAGAIESGDVCIGAGTSTDWRVVTTNGEPDGLGRGAVARHAIADHFMYEAVIEGTGSSMRWFRELVGGQDYANLIESAADIAPGADGLFFIPFVDGAHQAPRYVEGVRGGFLGIRSGHTRSHCVRAIMEGIAFQYPLMFEVIAPYSDASGHFPLVDGEARSPLWNQLKADVMGHPVSVPDVPDAAAMGSAILAGQAAGIFADHRAGVAAMLGRERIYEPDLKLTARYTELRSDYEAALLVFVQASAQRAPGACSA